MTYLIGDVILYRWRIGKMESNHYFLTKESCLEAASIKNTEAMDVEVFENYFKKPSAELLIFYLFSWFYYEKYEAKDMDFIVDFFKCVSNEIAIEVNDLLLEIEFFKQCCMLLSNKDMNSWLIHLEHNDFEYLYDVFKECKSKIKKI